MGKGKNAKKIQRSYSKSPSKDKVIKKTKKINTIQKKANSDSISNSSGDEYQPLKFKTYVEYDEIKLNKNKNLEVKYVELAEKLANYSHEEIIKFWQTPKGFRYFYNTVLFFICFLQILINFFPLKH